MKILVATGLYPPESGGPATYSKLIETELRKRGAEVVVVPFSMVRHLPKGVRHIAYFFKIFRMKADLIYALDPVSVGYPAALAARMTGRKFLLRVAGDYAWEQGQARFGVTDLLDDFQTRRYGFRIGLLRKIQRLVARRALRIVVPSHYMKHIVSQWLTSHEVEKISVIYSSIELPVTYSVPVDRPKGFLVVSVGRRVPWKGFEALARVVGKEPSWQLRIAENLPREEALGWVKAADVFVLNSTYEGLSHVLIETMSLGTPIIATNIGGNPELIEDGKHGLLIPPQNDEALYAALKNVERDPQAAKTRAEAAKMRVQNFSITQSVDVLAEFLKIL